jgi:hypothetical protein
MRKLLLLLLFFIPSALQAQITITGKVISVTDKKPVANASIFLSNSKVGNMSLKDGSFTLSNVKNGQYDLVVTCIGFEPLHQTISVRGNDIQLPTIALKDKTSLLGEVKINGGKRKRDYKRERYIRIFTREFLGRTKNAAECKILNPDVLQFEYDEPTDRMHATATDFLVIENKALGYRIKYLLVSFEFDPINGTMYYTGPSVFEPMEGTTEQEDNWVNRRVNAYNGSMMSFLRACLVSNVSGAGFKVFELFRTPTIGREPDSLINAKVKFYSKHTAGIPQYWSKQSNMPKFDQYPGKVLKTNDYLNLTDEKGIYAFGYTPTIHLMINYKHEQNGSNYHTSFITFLDKYTYFDSNGVISTPLKTVVEGYWQTLRIADQLPVDYELPNGRTR